MTKYFACTSSSRCFILKVQYLASYERVRASKKARIKDNLWDANSRAISKSHCLDFLLLQCSLMGSFVARVKKFISHPGKRICRGELQLLELSATLTRVYTRKFFANFHSIHSRKFAKYQHVFAHMGISQAHAGPVCVHRYGQHQIPRGPGILQVSNGKRRKKDAFKCKLFHFPTPSSHPLPFVLQQIVVTSVSLNLGQNLIEGI